MPTIENDKTKSEENARFMIIIEIENALPYYIH